MAKHFLFFFFFFISNSRAWSDFDGVQRLTECLSAAGVDNYTVPPSEPSDAANSTYYSLLNFSIQNLRFTPRPGLARPAAVVLPGSKLHLRSAVLCCRADGFGVRIRSGGHSYEGLSYSAEYAAAPFVVVDLMRLNRVLVDVESRTTWVEAGATLGETYHAIAAASDSLAFSAGSCPTVGSGGHIAGGGFGLLSRTYGLAADNVLDAVLIAADGRVMDRDAMGEDVFWAIRGGGGGGWGAVYAWQIRLRPVPARVTAFIVNRPGSTPQVAELIHKWQLVAPSLPDEFYLSAFVGAGLPESDHVGMSATFKGFYLGPKPEAISIMTRAFPELKLSNSECHEMSWIESVVFFSGLPNGSTVSDLKNRILGGKKSFKAKSDYVRFPISKPDLTRAFDTLSAEPKAYLILDPYGGVMDKISCDHLPFPHRSGNLYAIQYLIEWQVEDDGRSEEYLEWMRAYYAHMADSVSKGPRAAYVNYLDLDLGMNDGWTVGDEGARDRTANSRSWGEKYFLGNYDRLVRAKTMVDPDDVFNNVQSIPPMMTRYEI
ncbi:reticuline oxidase-like [Canna indica]|uniref:Reticuline oxidase-like n=1 Tax=Canna indica TaxID=4628 RepID=A0AAQ3KBJ5_9LILI|nr:reticuline oxidase-like [Canna indica]